MQGKRLRLARKRAGASMQELAECMTPTVSAQAIGKYEAGKLSPSSSILVGLAKALDVSLDFLMRGEIDGLEFRLQAGVSVHDRAKVEANLMDHLERYLVIERILGEQAGLDRVESCRRDSVATVEQVDETADELREVLRLGMGHVPSLCALLEDMGIKVVLDDLPQRVNGLACRALQNGELVAEALVVCAGVSVECKRIKLARELGRRVIRATSNPAITLDSALDRFAGAFLIPCAHLIHRVGGSRKRVTYREIIRLKKSYGVPAVDMLRRLGEVGALPSGAVRNALATFARSWRHIEPEPIQPQHRFAAFENPRRFERLVWHAVAEELISPVRAASLLNQSLDEDGTADRRPISMSAILKVALAVQVRT